MRLGISWMIFYTPSYTEHVDGILSNCHGAVESQPRIGNYHGDPNTDTALAPMPTRLPLNTSRRCYSGFSGAKVRGGPRLEAPPRTIIFCRPRSEHAPLRSQTTIWSLRRDASLELHAVVGCALLLDVKLAETDD